MPRAVLMSKPARKAALTDAMRGRLLAELGALMAAPIVVGRITVGMINQRDEIVAQVESIARRAYNRGIRDVTPRILFDRAALIAHDVFWSLESGPPGWYSTGIGGTLGRHFATADEALDALWARRSTKGSR